MTTYSLLIILGCGLVTWLQRVIPVILVRKVQLHEIVIRIRSEERRVGTESRDRWSPDD